MTYSEICRRLDAAGVDAPSYEATLLLEHFCDVPRAELPFRKNEDFSSAELICAVEKREKRYPLQYIIGEWSFCNESYKVGEGCLIPRSDTEMLVMRASELLPRGASFLDLCTGSGCIAVSLLKRRSDCTAVAVDISDVALRYAAENARRNGVDDRVTFVTSDILDPSSPAELFSLGNFSAILSNPPYIKCGAAAGLEPELSFEPSLALFGGDDGMVFYRAIVDGFLPYVMSEGFVLFEIGYDLGKDISILCADKGYDCVIEKDLAGNDRLAYVRPSDSNNDTFCV